MKEKKKTKTLTVRNVQEDNFKRGGERYICWDRVKKGKQYENPKINKGGRKITGERPAEKLPS